MFDSCGCCRRFLFIRTFDHVFVPLNNCFGIKVPSLDFWITIRWKVMVSKLTFSDPIKTTLDVFERINFFWVNYPAILGDPVGTKEKPKD